MVVGDKPARLLLLFSRPGFEMFFAEGGSPLDQPPAGPPNPDAFRRLVEKYDMELLETRRALMIAEANLCACASGYRDFGPLVCTNGPYSCFVSPRRAASMMRSVARTIGGQLGAGVDVQLLIDVHEVRGHRPFADAEPGGDLAVRKTMDDVADDLALAVAELLIEDGFDLSVRDEVGDAGPVRLVLAPHERAELVSAHTPPAG